MKLKEEIDHAVANFIVKLVHEPLSYFSEADLQQLLIEELRKIKEFSKTYPTSVKRGKDSKSVYNTSLIHREYGAGEGSRIDVVIFDKKDVQEINDINLTIGGKDKYLHPLYAFELGTEKSPDTKNHFQNDITKLKRCKETGYLIHVYKDVTQSKSGTGRREETEKRINADFKEIFNTAKYDSKVRVLALLLRGPRNQKKMRGKCELFMDGVWKQINVNKPKEINQFLMEQLI